MSMKKSSIEMPKFKNESEEADWWARPAGRAFVKQRSTEGLAKKIKFAGSPLVAELAKKSSVQIALRMPASDIAQARAVAERKGIGYQTLLKMYVREGLNRETRRR